MPDASLFHEHRLIVDVDGRAELHPGFLDTATADALLATFQEIIPWEQADLIVYGQKVREPRQSVWFAPPGMDYVYSHTTRRAHEMPPELRDLLARAEAATGAQYNSALLNHYRDGNDRLGWHADNEECNGPEPTIASVSLGAERRFDLRHVESGETHSVLLPHGSLLVMSGRLQRHWVHQVPAMKRVASPRVNVTFRLVS